MRSILLLAVLLCIGLFANAQAGGSAGSSRFMEINPFGGYTTSSKLDFGIGKYRAFGSGNFGGSLGFGMTGSAGSKNILKMIQLQYNFQPTDMEIRFYSSNETFPQGALNVHTISIGALQGVGTDPITLYGGGYLGMTIYDPENGELDGHTTFTPSFAAGLNYAVNDQFGFRIHSQLYMPVWGADFALGWCIGCGGLQPTAFSSALSVYANFNGGIYYRFVQ